MRNPEKKAREEIVRQKMIEAKNIQWVSYVTYVRMLDHKPYAISLFINWKKWLHISRIEKLERHFWIVKE